MPFLNRIRLRTYLSKPQFPSESNIFKLADGSRKVQSIVISKVYTGETDLYPEWIHQRLKIALSHDTVNFEGDKYFGGASTEGDYDIDWSEFLDYPYAKAGYKMAVTPFAATNSNCQTCEEASQLALVDDTFPDQIEQSTEYTIDLFANDTINCTPIEVEITYANAVFIDTAEIDVLTGILTIMTKPLFFKRNSVKLITYRVTCTSSGAYDEADVFGNLEGSEAACLEPTALVLSAVDYNVVSVSWTAPTPAPANGYEWKIATEVDPATIVDSGTVLTLTAGTDTILDPATGYIFSVRSFCDTDDYSEWVDIHVDTLALDEDCGRYTIEYLGTTGRRDVSYIACNNQVKTTSLFPFRPRTICALQNSPGSPVSIIGADQITYDSPC